MSIRQAPHKDLEILAPLFDAYRQFYRQNSDLEKATRFLKERISRKESVIYIAFTKEVPKGFIQLYPIFSSLTMEALYVLNDLYNRPRVSWPRHRT